MKRIATTAAASACFDRTEFDAGSHKRHGVVQKGMIDACHCFMARLILRCLHEAVSVQSVPVRAVLRTQVVDLCPPIHRLRGASARPYSVVLCFAAALGVRTVLIFTNS